MKTILALFLLFCHSAVAGENSFQRLQGDPLYVQVQKSCIPGDVPLSLIRLEEDFATSEIKIALKDGLISSIGRANPLKVDEQVKALWESTQLFLGLIDCFGNDEKGLFVSKAFIFELVLEYSTTQAAAWGAPQLAGAKLFAFAFTYLNELISSAISQIGWVSELLESNPQLLPRMRKIWKWGLRIGAVSYGFVRQHQASIARQKENEKAFDEQEKYFSEEKQFDIELEKRLVVQLKEKHHFCLENRSCPKIQELIDRLEKDK
jgi:hypothetical protein